MSPSGEVITREVNPVPAAVVVLVTVLAPKIRSLALPVVAAPLSLVVPVPEAPAVTSTGEVVSMPPYSKIRMSGNCAAWLKFTITVFPPTAAATFLA
jgi:hypothetical protein